MKVGVVRETTVDERRVSLVPDGVTRLTAAGLQVSVETGAGLEAFINDEAYQKAGATIAPAANTLLKEADAVLKVQAPSLDEVSSMHSGALSISFLQPSTNADVVRALARQGVTAFSLELVPRISRAQSMDALSSQAGVAGYKSVLMAANRLGKFFPLLITAAGTVTPARVLVLGAGVAGLQAIVPFTLRIMSDVSREAFMRVQRFSTDWHANSFAGSTVRKITRGMFALDLLNDTLLIALMLAIRSHYRNMERQLKAVDAVEHVDHAVSLLDQGAGFLQQRLRDEGVHEPVVAVEADGCHHQCLQFDRA